VRGPTVGVVLLLFFVLQVTVADAISFGKIGPDFPLLIVVYFAVFRGALGGSVIGFAVGLLQDFFNPSNLGLNALAKSIVGYAMGRTGAQTERDNPLFLVAVFGVAALAHDFIYLLFFTRFHLGKFIVTWSVVGVPSAIYTAVVGAIVHALVVVFLNEAVRHLGKTRSY
jgi:rod shape-determining protein MreD